MRSTAACMFLALRMSAGLMAQTQSAPVSQPASAPGALASQPSSVTLPATIIPDEQVELYAKVSGYVSQIDVDIGARVKRGDILVQLDVPELNDELRQVEATLATQRARIESKRAKGRQAELLIESARAEEQRYAAEQALAEITFNRKQELMHGNAIPPQEFDVARNGVDLANAQRAVGRAIVAAAEGDATAARADVMAAEAEAAVAEADLQRVRTLIGYTTIRAPFDGVLTQRGVDHGAFVRSAAQGAGRALLTIDKVDVVRVAVDVPESIVPRVTAGAAVRIEIGSQAGKTIEGRITRAAGAIRPDSRSMRTEIDLPNEDGSLVPGMFARVTIQLGAARSAGGGGG